MTVRASGRSNDRSSRLQHVSSARTEGRETTYIEASRSRRPALNDERDGQTLESGSLPNLILPSFRQRDRFIVTVGHRQRVTRTGKEMRTN